MKTKVCFLFLCLLFGCSQNKMFDNNVDRDIKSGTWGGSNKLESPLQSAVYHNNLEYLKRLLDTGHDINFVDSKQKNLLHIAAQYSDIDMNTFLVQHGVSVNKKDLDSWTPLNYACRYNKAEIVKLYIDNGADFNNLSHSPVSNALTGANAGMLNVIGMLADKGFNLNDSSSDPVHRAIAYDMVGAAKLMIEKGASVRRTSDNGWNYLHWCAYYGSVHCAQYFKQFEELRTLTPLRYKTETYIGNNDTTLLFPEKLSAIEIAKMGDHQETLKYLE